MSKLNIDLVIDKVLKEKKSEVDSKVEIFSEINKDGYKETFLELVYVILAAGTSAKLALSTVDILKKDDFVFNKDLTQIIKKLKGCYRFYNLRGKYIYNTREYIRSSYNNSFKKIFNDNSSHYRRRSFFSSNPKVQGVGMKAASHFLRNIGFNDYAILDKHIINLMKECGLISLDFKTLNEKNYIAIENILRKVGSRHNLTLSSLDLVLWYFKTGKIIK